MQNSLAVSKNGSGSVAVRMEKYTNYRELIRSFDERVRNCSMVPFDELAEVAAEIKATLTPVAPKNALPLVKMLYSQYPMIKPKEVEAFVASAATLFSEYPEYACKAAVKSLPRKHSFPPTIADITAELDRQVEPLKMDLLRLRRMHKKYMERKAQLEREEKMKKDRDAWLKKYGDKTPLEVMREKHGPIVQSMED